ncbi:MAG: hypothetical protein LBL64_06695, partial [Treponema sp.]|nr:hypothetical protein [Treponema sp.]
RRAAPFSSILLSPSLIMPNIPAATLQDAGLAPYGKFTDSSPSAFILSSAPSQKKFLLISKFVNMPCPDFPYIGIL